MRSITIHVAKKVFQHSNKIFSIFTLTLFVFSSVFVINQYAEAQQLVCPMRLIQQITDDPSGQSENPSINADGTLIAFESRANINGGNPDGSDEIWLPNALTGIITQITDDPSTSSFDPTLSADGSLIAFESSADHTGGNPDGNQEIFLFDTTTSMFTQVTDTVGGASNRDTSISGNNLFIAFESNANINGGNPDGNVEIWLFNTTTGVITQITDETVGDSDDPSINGDGTRIAFESNANINGGNPDGNDEIWLVNTTTGIITKITHTTAPAHARDPSISADGTRIAFQSDADLNGGNPDGNQEIFLFDTTISMFTQVTDTVGGSSLHASISADGLFIAFRSSANINGENPGGNSQIWIFDTTTGFITQITDEPSGLSERPSINANGTRIAFESNANINGGNPAGTPDQIWLATCFDPATARNIPTLSEWSLIAMAGVLGIIGLLAIRRRNVTA